MPDNYPNLMDIARRSGDPKISKVLEVLNKNNPMLDDIPWTECNSGFTHITTIRTGIPKPAWRMLNAGTGNMKSTTGQIKAGCGMLEGYSEVDAKLVELSKRNGQLTGAADFLASEASAILEGFSQELAEAIFYGDASSPEKIIGLSSYYSQLPATAGKETNVIDGGGTGSDNTSIWLIGWGLDSICGIYPQGSVAGFREDYKGIQTVTDSDGKKFEAHRTHYQWDNGLVVRDWRCAVRIANVDVSDAVAAGSSAPDILTCLTRAIYKLPHRATSLRKVIYMRKELLTLLDLQCQKKSNLLLNYQNIDGQPILSFRGIPIKEQETLLTTETKVS